MDSLLKEAIKKNLRNRAKNDKLRTNRLGSKTKLLEKRLEEEERKYRVLQDHPDLLQKKLKREAQMKALRKAKEAEKAPKKPKPKAEEKAEQKPWSHMVEEQLPNGKWIKYDEVQNAIDELEPFGIVDKKSFREFARKYHPDRKLDHGLWDTDDGSYQNEMFGDVMKLYDIAKKAKVPGFF
jgi:hypothetical protein